MPETRITVAHSPDSDDAFMFWGLASGVVDPRAFEFEHVLADIQTLNEWALEARLEVTAISLHAYPAVQDDYVILPHGASMGSGYGPIVVSTEAMSVDDLREIEVSDEPEEGTDTALLRTGHPTLTALRSVAETDDALVEKWLADRDR